MIERIYNYLLERFLLQDLIAFAVSSLLVFLYYLYLHRRTRYQPDFTLHALNTRVRFRWVEMVMANNSKMDILAVQTLRNSVMACNFMASTAVLVIIGILTLSENTQELAIAWKPVLQTESTSNVLCLVKQSLLILDFFIAFCCFSMAIRFFNHVGYMINLPADTIMHGFSPKQIGAYLNRAGTYYIVIQKSSVRPAHAYA